MKIVQMSDIHSDFETLDYALGTVQDVIKPDVVAVTGDLTGEVFDEEEARSFMGFKEALYPILAQCSHKSEGKVGTFSKTARYILRDKKAGRDLKKYAKAYLGLVERAKHRKSLQYAGLKNRFNQLESKVLVVPGNWDTEQIDESLGEENLHLKEPVDINGVSFIGYGGSPEIPMVIPGDQIVGFNEGQAYEHLVENGGNADVALVHNPAAGRLTNYALKAFMNLAQPSLLLQGHAHEVLIAEDEATKTFVCNSGNLGRYGNHDYGTFLEIDIDEETGFVRPVAGYTVREDGVYREELEVASRE